MDKAWLIRTSSTVAYTTGCLIIRGELFYTLERAWKNNKSNLSCIPTGEYKAIFLAKSASGKYSNVYHLQNVPERYGILIHNGNLVSHTRGCILLGTRLGVINGQTAVLNSRTAMRKFNKVAAHENFMLEIR